MKLYLYFGLKKNIEDFEKGRVQSIRGNLINLITILASCFHSDCCLDAGCLTEVHYTVLIRSAVPLAAPLVYTLVYVWILVPSMFVPSFESRRKLDRGLVCLKTLESEVDDLPTFSKRAAPSCDLEQPWKERPQVAWGWRYLLDPFGFTKGLTQPARFLPLPLLLDWIPVSPLTWLGYRPQTSNRCCRCDSKTFGFSSQLFTTKRYKLSRAIYMLKFSVCWKKYHSIYVLKKTVLGSYYTCFAYENKTKVERILIIFQDILLFSHINEKLSRRDLLNFISERWSSLKSYQRYVLPRFIFFTLYTM